MKSLILLRRYGLLTVIGLLIVGAIVSGVWRDLSFSELAAHHAALKAAVAAHPLLGPAAYFAVFTAVVSACIPGPGLMSVASGYLFGTLVGGLVSLAAFLAGSALVFLACRGAFADLIARRGGALVRELEANLGRDAFGYLLVLKLIPALPYFVANVAAGLAGVRLSRLLAATAIGSAPVCFLLASLGASLSRLLDHGVAPDRHVLARPGVFLPLLGLTLLSVAAIAFRAIRRRRSLPAPPP